MRKRGLSTKSGRLNYILTLTIYLCACYRIILDYEIDDRRLADRGTLVVAAACNVVARIIILDNSYG
jgi:hypothetical protein